MSEAGPSPDTRGVPRNVEAERSVLGSLLLDPASIGDVSQVVKADDFYMPAHRLVFDALVTTFDERSTSDLILIEEHLSRQGLLEEAGGRDSLLDVAGSVVSSAGAMYHAEIVRDKAIQRKLLETCLDLSRLAYENAAEAKDLLDEAERRIFEIARVNVAADVKGISEVLRSVLSGSTSSVRMLVYRPVCSPTSSTSTR